MADVEMPDVALDEDLHSRQLAVYGRESMKRMAGSKVLIVGLNGLGCEIAKNVILASLKAVCLADTEAVQMADLSSQFYVTEADVGKNRAQACLARLQELNSSVAVSAHTEAVTEEFLSQFQVVVFCNHNPADLKKFDAFCHSKNIAFIKVDSRGVFGNIFCDFGTDFVVNDVDGEEPATGIIASISDADPALVTCVEDEKIEFEDGDMVIFKEVQGMSLNDGTPRTIKNVSKKNKSFEVELAGCAAGGYARGGIVETVKQPKTLNFKTLEEAETSPGELLLFDFAKESAQHHVAFLALDAFQAKNGRLPGIQDAGDADALVEAAKEINGKLPEGVRVDPLDEDLVKALARGSRADLCPMAAVLGGFTAQEVLKAVSHKFHPLFQWFYFDSKESIPDDVTAASAAPTGSRYDGQVAAIGGALQKKLENMKLFLVGAGALGCEFLKNYAMMGVSCGSGRLTVTDDDTIEKSNLSRQFLFRDAHLRQSKSAVASAAAQAINPALKVQPLQNRVSPETEEVFDDSFWEGLDLVTNALDNVNARLYVDSRCIYFQRPLLESGTLGAKCNTQMVIPLLTEHYGAARDPPEKQAPMCTLHSFPHNIDHCLTWARSEFDGLFEKAPAAVSGWLEKSDFGQSLADQNPSEACETLQKVAACLHDDRCRTFEDCIAWARRQFEVYGVNLVKQLTFTFPEDANTSTGAPFWSPPKRFPRPVAFNPTDPMHQRFIMATANLRAHTYGLVAPDWNRDLAKIGQVAGAVAVPEFVPKKGVKIDVGEKKESDPAPAPMDTGDDTEQLQTLMSQLSTTRSSLETDFKMSPLTFEKDDDTNFHMDFVSACANLRARVYSIEEVDFLQAKLIAGRIIPAIATATAVAAGLVCLEVYKLASQRAVESYRNSFVNLALPLVAMSEPAPPQKTKFQEHEWSVWERWVIPGNPTLQELIDWFQSTRGISASIVSFAQSLLYADFMPAHKSRLPKKLVDVAREVSKTEFPKGKNFIDFVVACEDDEGNDVDVPIVSVRLPSA